MQVIKTFNAFLRRVCPSLFAIALANSRDEDANTLTARAHRASAEAAVSGDSDSHFDAALLHHQASQAQRGARNKDTAEMHDSQVSFHRNKSGASDRALDNATRRSPSGVASGWAVGNSNMGESSDNAAEVALLDYDSLFQDELAKCGNDPIEADRRVRLKNPGMFPPKAVESVSLPNSGPPSDWQTLLPQMGLPQSTTPGEFNIIWRTNNNKAYPLRGDEIFEMLVGYYRSLQGFQTDAAARQAVAQKFPGLAAFDSKVSPERAEPRNPFIPARP